MSSLRDIKNRIKSVSSTKQIAKAMEVVSATKMKRAQELAIGSRPFTRSIFELISNINYDVLKDHELVRPRPILKELIIVITSDKGLAGVYNSNILKTTDKYIKQQRQLHDVDIITIGKKAREYYSRRQANIIKEYNLVSDYVSEKQSRQISELILEKFKNKNHDKVTIIYTDFISTLKQEVTTMPILPIEHSWLLDKISSNLPTTQVQPYERKFEPSASEIIDIALDYTFHFSIFKSILESNASEHSARMLAMKKASDNASDIVSSLSLEYNKSRQAGITQELIEIVSGAESI